MINLEMDFTFNNLAADIKIWNCATKKFRNITALFDTGACISAIDSDIFVKLGYKFYNARDIFVTTASHNQFATKRTIIHDLMLGDFEIGPFIADVFKFPIVSYQMILGLNIIKEFKTILDFENETIQMTPRYKTEKIPIDKFDCDNSRFGECKLSGINFININKITKITEA